MDNAHFRTAVNDMKAVSIIYQGTNPTIEHRLALAQVSALLAIADALDSIDDALRNTVGGCSR